jgi:hypothetical protein
MEITKQDKRDIDKTLDILLSTKVVLNGLKDEDTYCDAIDVAILWLERITYDPPAVIAFRKYMYHHCKEPLHNHHDGCPACDVISQYEDHEIQSEIKKTGRTTNG